MESKSVIAAVTIASTEPTISCDLRRTPSRSLSAETILTIAFTTPSLQSTPVAISAFSPRDISAAAAAYTAARRSSPNTGSMNNSAVPPQVSP